MNPDITSDTFSLLGLGFLLGLRHSLDADHLAAVATLVSRRRTVMASSSVGLLWGIGHTIALVGVGGLLMMFDLTIPPMANAIIELIVAGVLIVMGVNLLFKLLRGGTIHDHPHSHGMFVHSHAHVHSHSDAGKRGADGHIHSLLKTLKVNGSGASLLLGMLHGLAGSGALMLIIAATVTDFGFGVMYLAFFGIGSIIGMWLMSIVIGIPFLHGGRHRVRVGLQATAGIASIVAGFWLGAALVIATAGLLV